MELEAGGWLSGGGRAADRLLTGLIALLVDGTQTARNVQHGCWRQGGVW
jgi:hypothetical protein